MMITATGGGDRMEVEGVEEETKEEDEIEILVPEMTTNIFLASTIRATTKEAPTKVKEELTSEGSMLVDELLDMRNGNGKEALKVGITRADI